MVLTLTSALSLFLLISLSTIVFFVSKQIKVPYTVLLVFVGILLVPIVNMPGLEHVFGFIDDLVLTPELLFYIFLPILIFESAFNMNMRKMLDSAWAISSFAIVSLLISASIIAGLIYFIMPLIGIEIPLIMALLLGAIISPTDPVAVLSMFKEFGVPRRLAMIFEGESLMNDGTAMALFLVLLSIAVEGFHGGETVVHGLTQFATMIVLGVFLGLGMAAIISKSLAFTKKNEFVTVTLLIISAHLVFITSELIAHVGIAHVSSIIATTVASLFLGNYSRNVLEPRVDEYLGKLIEHMAFVANSLVFLMAGLLFASSGVDFLSLWLPILVTVLIVGFARVVSIYAVVTPLNMSGVENKISSAWQKLLAWASLRGALSIIIVLLVPEDFAVDGWKYAHSPRDFLLALVIGCILASLFIKAPLIGPIIRKLRINAPEPLNEAHEADLAVHYLLSEQARLQDFHERGYVSEKHYKELVKEIGKNLTKAYKKRDKLVKKHGIDLFNQSLHLSMIHVEKRAIKTLFHNAEVSERAYRKIYSKLCLQQEQIEDARHDEINPAVYTDRKDIFDRLVNLVLAPFGQSNTQEPTIKERMEHYRAQMIMARKAVRTIEHMQHDYAEPTFLKESYDAVCTRYKRYKQRSGEKMEALVSGNKKELSDYVSYLADRSLAASGMKAMGYMHDNGLLDEETEKHIEEGYALSSLRTEN